MKKARSGMYLLAALAMLGLAACSGDDGDSIVAPPTDVTTLDTQAKLDAFGAQGHTDYAEQLVIGVENQPNTSISNLDALSGLTSVKGLTLYYNDELVDLSGLKNLAAIGSDGLVVEENAKLTNLSGLIGLQSVGGNTIIAMNGIIETLSGLGNLTSIGGNLVIEKNPVLKRVDGLSRLESLGGTVLVSRNGMIADLSGLSSLSSVDGGLIFLNNPTLADYCGLQHLLFVGYNGIYSAVGNAVNPTLAEIGAAFCD